MTDALSLRISSLADDELVRHLTVDAARYSEEALGLDWLDKGATVLACAACGRIEWFRTPPARASE